MNPRIEELKSLKDAFDGMDNTLKARSQRVAEYCDVLFLELCGLEAYEEEKAAARCKVEYRGAVMAAALYHSIGKCLLPPQYYSDRNTSLTEDEVRVYRSYLQNGLDIIMRWPVAGLQGAMEQKIVEEGLADQEERWNGTGWPNGKKGDEISVIGRMIAACDILDYYASTLISDRPFDDAYNTVMRMGGEELDPTIIEVLPECKAKLRRVFNRYKDDSRMIPQLDFVVPRKANRPMWLDYRPFCDMQGNVRGYRAAMRFRFTYNNPSGHVGYDVVQAELKKQGMEDRVGEYFLLEGCDTLYHLHACHIEGVQLMLPLPDSWYQSRRAPSMLAEALADSEVDPAAVILLVRAARLAASNKIVQNNIAKFAEKGVRVLVYEAAPDAIAVADCAIPGVSGVVLAEGMCDALETPEAAAYIKALLEANLTVYADGVQKKATMEQLDLLGAQGAMGLYVGDSQSESEMVRSEIAAAE